MKKIGILALIVMAILSCKKNELCGPETIISAEQYAEATEDDIQIRDLSIDGNCLKIKFSAGGCTGDTWDVKLIDSGSVLESYPPQRNLKLTLTNAETCEALITKEVNFDISNLKVDGEKVVLNIVNCNQSIVYNY